VIITLFLLACGEPDTVQPLVDARADGIGVSAAPGVRLAVASGALGAWLCSLDQTDLRELAQDPDTGSIAVPTIDAPVDVATNLGIGAAGSVFWNTETGISTMSFTGSLDSAQALTIDVVVETPTRDFEISFRDPDGSEYSAAAQVGVEDCAVSPRVQVELELDDGDDEIRVVLPDSDGEVLEWNSGQFAPRTGTASWSTGSGVSKETWLADDADTLDDGQWPGTASSGDWSAAATVSLSRPD
jgi:hypothetical protein